MLFEELAVQLSRLKNAQAQGREDNVEDALARIKDLEDRLPHGSGFDAGVKVLVDACRDNKLVLSAPFHSLDEWGGYLSWEEYVVEVTPVLVPPGINLKFSRGKSRDGLKDYVGDCLFEALTEDV